MPGKEEHKDLAIIEKNDSAEILIARAIDKGVPVETMERLLAMRRELKDEFAKEEFTKAMAAFQNEAPTIVKTKEVKTKAGIVAYRYAPIESIVEQVKGALKTNGFSYSTNMKLLPTGVEVSVKVTHIAGHSEITDMSVPLGNKTEIMSQSQVVAAASTFAKRYAFCNAFGILTGDEDNDGQNVGAPPVAPRATMPARPMPARPAATPVRPAQPVQRTVQQAAPARRATGFGKCSDCQTNITPAESDYSQKHYGMELCRKCQTKYKRRS